MVYSKVVERKFRRPTSQKSIVRKLGNPDIEWSVTYSSVYKITNDSKLRIFQYKILNNCLFLNMNLFQFKKIESPNCAFCKSQIETLEHFFIDCSYSRNYYISIKNWLEKGHIYLPKLNMENVILGGEGNNLEKFLFLLYKYTLYTARGQCQSPTLKQYQKKLIQYENLEHIIAKKNCKLLIHLQKYEKIRNIIEDLKKD